MTISVNFENIEENMTILIMKQGGTSEEHSVWYKPAERIQTGGQ